MNAYKIGAAVMLAAVSLPAAADDVYYDTARVLSVTPQMERVNTPRQECRTEYTRETYSRSDDRSIGGAIIGTIAGGLLGSQIGKGNGRVAGAAVGAATGAIVGDRIDNDEPRRYASRPVERCEMVDNWQTVTRNFVVAYRYNGRDYTTVMPNDPGSSIRIRVAVGPDDDDHVSSLDSGYRDKSWRGWRHRDYDRD